MNKYSNNNNNNVIIVLSIHDRNNVIFNNICFTNKIGPGFNTQSRTASYQRRYKNGTSSALV